MAINFVKSPALWTPQRTSAVASRLHRAYLEVPPEIKRLGAQFYPTWNDTAQHIGSHIGKTTDHGAAILAHLSPSNEAELNRLQGMQLVHSLGPEQHAMLVQAGKHASMEKSAEVRLRHMPVGSREHRQLAEEHAYHKSENARLRKASGIVGTPLGFPGSRELGNASAVLLGHHDSDPLGSLESMKISDFGGDIANPRSPRVAIDTHYHDMALGRTDIPYKADRGLSAKGRYEHFQNASATAHSHTLGVLGLSEEELPHPAFMGGLWYEQQHRKVASNPEARSARQASETKLAKIMADPRNAHFLPETHGLQPSFNKVRF